MQGLVMLLLPVAVGPPIKTLSYAQVGQGGHPTKVSYCH